MTSRSNVSTTIVEPPLGRRASTTQLAWIAAGLVAAALLLGTALALHGLAQARQSEAAARIEAGRYT